MGCGQSFQEPLKDRRQGVIRSGLAGKDRIAADRRNSMQIENTAQRRFDIAGDIGVPVLTIRSLRVPVGVDRQYLRMALRTAR